MLDSFLPQPRLVRPSGSDLRVSEPANPVETISAELAPEAYVLHVDATGATLTAGSEAGLRHGRVTWTQLLERATSESGSTTVPGVHIEDEPAYGWRGLMVDCSRFFTPIAELERLVDALAMHRMNRLHLHLTDDQGWRVEIDGWPRLTEVGAWRDRTLVGHHRTLQEAAAPEYTDEPHGGFYTQDELRALVAYANDRGVTLVPEIDLPGHMQAAVASYPELGNLDQPVGVRDVWGISDHVLAPTEAAFRFVREVLTQVVDIFPGPWVHIGGDECPTTEWERSDVAQRFMAEHGLTTEREIQREFLRVAHEVIAGAGRTIVGWDEIIEAEPPADAVAMLWRPHTDVALAREHGLASVYANARTLYLDYYQADPEREPLAIGGLTTLADVYATTPLGPDEPAEDAGLLGVQAQLWREYIPTDQHLEYMLFPRLCAVSEVAWGTRTTFEDFHRRLTEHHLARLQAAGLTHAPA